MSIKDIKKLKISTLIFSFLILAAFVFSFISWAGNFPGVRKTFAFHSIQGDIEYVESRYLPSDPEQGLEKYYVEELLLGPLNELSRPLFTRGTKLTFFSLEDSVLSVGLSDEILNVDLQNTDFDGAFKLFQKNILKNFSSIKSVEIYIDGSDGLCHI